MTWAAQRTDAAVADRQQLLALALHMDSAAPVSGAAQITAPTPSAGEWNAMIARRAAKLRFPNEIQRQRFISRHSLGAE